MVCEAGLHQEHLVPGQGQASAALVGNGASPATGKPGACGDAAVSVGSCFRRGRNLQEGLFCMEMAAQGKGKALAIVASQGSDGH